MARRSDPAAGRPGAPVAGVTASHHSGAHTAEQVTLSRIRQMKKFA